MQSSNVLQIAEPAQQASPPKKKNTAPTYQWTIEKEQSLVNLHALGTYSIREIALALFNTELARNSVAGKMFRLGMCRKSIRTRPAKAATVPQKPPRGIGYSSTRFGPQPDLLVRAFKKDLKPADLLPADTNFLCTLDGLGPDSCRCPIGDPESADFRFCGVPGSTMPGPYCGFHHGILCQTTAGVVKRPAIAEVTEDRMRIYG